MAWASLRRRSAPYDPDGTLETTPAWPWQTLQFDDSTLTEAPRVRVSGLAILGLILGVVGVCAVLTGQLAPEGLLLGALGVLASLAGLAATRHRWITGRGVATLSLLVAILAGGLALLAMTGRYAWLNAHTDRVHTWHTWLVAHVRWLRRW